MTKPDVKLATELEADALRYPDERGEILLEAADVWLRAGDVKRAVEILTELIAAADGDERCSARGRLVDVYFEAGADHQAYAELAVLAKDPSLAEWHCEPVAELLAERGDLTEAARWYDRAAARLTADQLDALRRQDGWLSLATSIMIRGRRDVRQRLGREPDMLDELVADLPSLRQPVTSEQLLDALDSGSTPRQARMLTFQRAQRAEARRRWPDEYTQADEEYYSAAESRWRELRDAGTPSITVVPATVAGLVAYGEWQGGSPTDSAVKQGYCRTVPAEETITWPPARNAACWCGSGAKYKKCCGRPG